MNSRLYLLDTNMVSYLLSGRSPAVRQSFLAASETATVAVSTMTEAEVLYGLERHPAASRLRASFEFLFQTLQVLPWDSAAARAYGRLRARLEAEGKSLSREDLLIAAHAISLDAILVTRDGGFRGASSMVDIESWATDI